MRLPEVKTLFKASLYVAFGGISGCVYLYMKRMEEVSSSVFFKEAFKTLRAHQGAVQYMGEPIKQQGFKIGTPENYMTENYAQFQVRCYGPKDKGKLHLWAQNEGEWKVTRLELELNNMPDKRLLIKDGPKNPEIVSPSQQ